ncbi:MAG: hypothetical protein QGF59_21625, partial [Pirellulaceae bacterium]|nr:hypothetical protein [Pirellulaceae bacterium]
HGPIKSAIDELEQARMAFGKMIYEKGGAAPGAEDPAEDTSGDTEAAAGEDDAIDAEFEVKDS